MEDQFYIISWKRMGASSLHKRTWLVVSLDRWQISKTGWRTQFQHLALNGNFVTQKGSFGTLWRQRGSPPPSYHHQLFCLVCSDFHVWNIVLVNDVLQYSVLLIFLVGVSARTSSPMFPYVSKSLVPSSNIGKLSGNSCKRNRQSHFYHGYLFL